MTAQKRGWAISVKADDGSWVELCTIASADAPELRIRVPDGAAVPRFVPFTMVWTETSPDDDDAIEMMSEGGVDDS